MQFYTYFIRKQLLPQGFGCILKYHRGLAGKGVLPVLPNEKLLPLGESYPSTKQQQATSNIGFVVVCVFQALSNMGFARQGGVWKPQPAASSHQPRAQLSQHHIGQIARLGGMRGAFEPELARNERKAPDLQARSKHAAGKRQARRKQAASMQVHSHPA